MKRSKLLNPSHEVAEPMIPLQNVIPGGVTIGAHRYPAGVREFKKSNNDPGVDHDKRGRVVEGLRTSHIK
jgi:hypothetical protein